MRWNLLFYGIILFIIGVLIFEVLVEETKNPVFTHKKIVDCYDGNGAKILGLKCEKFEYNNYSVVAQFMFGLVLVIGSIFSGFILTVLSFCGVKKK